MSTTSSQSSSTTTSSGPATTTTITFDGSPGDSEEDASRSAMLFGIFIAFVVVVALLIAYGFARSRRLRAQHLGEAVNGALRNAGKAPVTQEKPVLWDVWLEEGTADIKSWGDIMPLSASVIYKPESAKPTAPEPPPQPRGYLRRLIQQQLVAPPHSAPRTLSDRLLFVPPQPAQPEPIELVAPKKEIDRIEVAVFIAMPWQHSSGDDDERPGPDEASGSGKDKPEWAHEHDHAQKELEEGMRVTDAYAIGVTEVRPDGKFDHLKIPSHPRSMDRSLDIIPDAPENVETAGPG